MEQQARLAVQSNGRSPIRDGSRLAAVLRSLNRGKTGTPYENALQSGEENPVRFVAQRNGDQVMFQVGDKVLTMAEFIARAPWEVPVTALA